MTCEHVSFLNDVLSPLPLFFSTILVFPPLSYPQLPPLHFLFLSFLLLSFIPILFQLHSMERSAVELEVQDPLAVIVRVCQLLVPVHPAERLNGVQHECSMR